MKKRAFAAAMAIALLLCGCAAPAEPPAQDSAKPQPTATARADVAAELCVTDVAQGERPTVDWFEEGELEKYDAFLQQMRTFSFASAQKLKEDTFVYSPLSLYLALSCTAGAASGQTREDMEKTLYPKGCSVDEAAKWCARLLTELEGDEQATIDIHTLITISNEYNINREFAQTAVDSYNGSTATANFASDAARDALNAWIEKKTRGMIRDMIGGEVNAGTAMVLLNSVYFLGEWCVPFDMAETKEETFHGKAGDTETDMMQQYAEMLYGENHVMQAARLGYLGGASMNVYLPKPGKTTADVLEALGNVQGGYAMMGDGIGTLRLPKFTAETTMDLKDLMTEMGLGSMMTGGLTGVTEGGDELYISAARQKAKIIVDEKGTEAAAVTESAAPGESAGVEEEPVTFEMTVDRPFVYTIEWGEIVLFVGVVSDLA